MNKKAMLDDLFDFLFTIFMAVFVLMFVGAYINGAAENRNEETIEYLEQVSLRDTALSDVRGRLAEGLDVETYRIRSDVAYAGSRPGAPRLEPLGPIDELEPSEDVPDSVREELEELYRNPLPEVSGPDCDQDGEVDDWDTCPCDPSRQQLLHGEECENTMAEQCNNQCTFEWITMDEIEENE
jgi:hypothetical protein